MTEAVLRPGLAFAVWQALLELAEGNAEMVEDIIDVTQVRPPAKETFMRRKWVSSGLGAVPRPAGRQVFPPVAIHGQRGPRFGKAHCSWEAQLVNEVRGIMFIFEIIGPTIVCSIKK